MSDVYRALEVAILAHHGQTDMANKPYIAHCGRVARNVERWFCSDDSRMEADWLPDLLCVAYLHDVVEDTAWTLNDLQRLGGFNQAVLDGVDAMTQRWFADCGDGTHGKHPYMKNIGGQLVREPLEDYWTRVKNNPLALIVKVHGDIPDNNDPARKEYLPIDRQLKLTVKYAKALAFLGETP